MSCSAIIDQVGCKPASAALNAAVDFTDMLDAGEALTGTPTVVEVTTSQLTLDNKAVSTGALTINNRAVAIGDAVQFRVSSGSASAGLTTTQINTLGAGPGLAAAGVATIDSDDSCTAVDDGIYLVRITATTTSTPAQTLIKNVIVKVTGDSA